MENNETIIEIQGIEERTGKSGRKYHSVSTQFGKMNVFEDEIVEKLKSCWKNDQAAVVYVVDNGNFKNIREFKRVGELKQDLPEIKPESFGKPDKILESRENKNQSVYTSYAKDIFEMLLRNTLKDGEDQNMKDSKEGLKMIMDMAIDLVKQARNEF